MNGKGSDEYGGMLDRLGLAYEEGVCDTTLDLEEFEMAYKKILYHFRQLKATNPSTKRGGAEERWRSLSTSANRIAHTF